MKAASLRTGMTTETRGNGESVMSVQYVPRRSWGSQAAGASGAILRRVSEDRPRPTFEFHVSRATRERYGLDDALFSLSGNVLLSSLQAVRAFASRINQRRRALTPPEPELSPGDLNAMGLIDEVFHYVAARYQQERDPRSLVKALDAIDRELGRERVDQALTTFADTFPVVAVHRGALSVSDWLAGETPALSHRAIALAELLMLRLANDNPAFAPFRELFDDRTLPGRPACNEVLEALDRWFVNRPRYG